MVYAIQVMTGHTAQERVAVPLYRVSFDGSGHIPATVRTPEEAGLDYAAILININ